MKLKKLEELSTLLNSLIQSPSPIRLCSRFVVPQLLGLMQSGITATVEHPDHIMIGTTKLISDEALQIGSTVFLGMHNRNFSLWYQDELDEYKELSKVREFAKKLSRDYAENQRIKKDAADSLAFWSQYELPFEYSIEIKEVLSGLTENSWGAGTKKNTKNHLYFKQDYTRSRLSRKAGDFLCSNTKSKHYANWSGTLGDGSNFLNMNGIKRIINCKQCLRLMERFKKPEIITS